MGGINKVFHLSTHTKHKAPQCSPPHLILQRISDLHFSSLACVHLYICFSFCQTRFFWNLHSDLSRSTSAAVAAPDCLLRKFQWPELSDAFNNAVVSKKAVSLRVDKENYLVTEAHPFQFLLTLLMCVHRCGRCIYICGCFQVFIRIIAHYCTNWILWRYGLCLKRSCGQVCPIIRAPLWNDKSPYFHLQENLTHDAALI